MLVARASRGCKVGVRLSGEGEIAQRHALTGCCIATLVTTASAHLRLLEAIHAPPDCGRSFINISCHGMFIERAYAERESLSDRDLERLRASLVDQVQRYEDAIRGYSPEKMEKYGRPFLARLRQKVADVDITLGGRGIGS